MQSITLTAVIDETHHLVVEPLPELPRGQVEVTIRPLANHALSPAETREPARAKLIAAGLVSAEAAAPDAAAVSDAELERRGRVFAGDQPLSEIIDAEREDRV